ncbi:MAG: hypothetical protein K5929_11170 [Lachnospiraceae bacterium]|nr:hypothetical protein [Lachnospiraceae bacterium]
MAIEIRSGIYEKIGIRVVGDTLFFTFQYKKNSKYSLKLYKKGTDEYEIIEMPDKYCIGEVCSFMIKGIDFSKYEYTMIADGEERLFSYTTSIAGREKWGDVSRLTDERKSLRGVFETEYYDWQGDEKPDIQDNEFVIYKLNVRGFTKEAKIEPSKRGTFEGVTEMIPYLKSLGINAVEFMPIYEFEELMPEDENVTGFAGWSPEARKGYDLLADSDKRPERNVRINYWGYGKGEYFAPKRSFAGKRNPVSAVRDMVKSLHAAGIQCFMEINFPEKLSLAYISDVLCHWVKDYHMDGFHLLGGDIEVKHLSVIPMLKTSKIFYDNIYSDDAGISDDCKLLYQYRDDFQYTLRRQINYNDNDMQQTLAQLKKQDRSLGFVNYFANNNGFTLADVFAYAYKHNEANGEQNTDGCDNNFSTNCGVEGVARKNFIKQLRRKRMKMAVSVLAVAQGCPLIYMGDELGNSAEGNNNPYCQDNRIGWLNWKTAEKYEDYVQYVKDLFVFRKNHKLLYRNDPVDMGQTAANGLPALSYHGRDAWCTTVSPMTQTVGILYCPTKAEEGEKCLYVAMNFSAAMSTIAIPRLPGKTALKYVFGTEFCNIEPEGGSVRIPPYTVWFFEEEGNE